jgi:hypothetical protein
MPKNNLIILTLLLLLAGCSKEPPHTYSEPLEQSGYERDELIAEHRAQPVEVSGVGLMYVAGPDVERKDCTRCHQPGKEPYRDESLPPGQDAHWNVTMQHAADMECFSCHNKEDPTRLVSVVDRDATLEKAYLHCGSCHKNQLESWKGGAHGKRVTGWDGVRIVKNCTGCHNPHTPARGTTLPVAQPTLTPERMKGH